MYGLQFHDIAARKSQNALFENFSLDLDSVSRLI
jgi:hypothetical protein